MTPGHAYPGMSFGISTPNSFWEGTLLAFVGIVTQKVSPRHCYSLFNLCKRGVTDKT